MEGQSEAPQQVNPVNSETSTNISSETDVTEAKSILEVSSPTNLVEAALNEPGKAPTPQEVAEAAWKWADNINGEGDIPAWFNNSKYKTIEEQAKAYPELEKKFGKFTGRPKDGYALELEKTHMDKGIDAKELADDPLIKDFLTYADHCNMNNEMVNDLVNLYVNEKTKMEQSFEIDTDKYIANELKKLGPNAKETIDKVVQFGKNNLPEDLHEAFLDNLNNAEVIQMFNILRQKTYVNGSTYNSNVPPPLDIDALKEKFTDPNFSRMPKDYQKKIHEQYKVLFPGTQNPIK